MSAANPSEGLDDAIVTATTDETAGPQPTRQRRRRHRRRRALPRLTVRNVRLVSGLILFAFVFTHLLNHALGLISLDAIEAGRRLFSAFWRESPVGPIFFIALMAHLGLGLHSIYARRRLRMPVAEAEAAQLILGLAIPPLLVIHIGHRGGASYLRHRARLPPCTARPVGRQHRRPHTPDGCHADRLEPWLHRPLLLAAAQALVPAGHAIPFRARHSPTRYRPAGLRQRRTRGRRTGYPAGESGWPSGARHRHRSRRRSFSRSSASSCWSAAVWLP